MKKLITIVGLSALVLSANAAQYATNLVTGGYLLLTNRASVYSIEVTAPRATMVQLFDANSMAAPYYGTNYVNAAYTAVAQYATNYVTSFIGQNGLTNWYTNAGTFTYTYSVAANTNALSPGVSLAVGPNTYAVYNTDALFAKGIVAVTETNVTMVINYRPGK